MSCAKNYRGTAALTQLTGGPAHALLASSQRARHLQFYTCSGLTEDVWKSCEESGLLGDFSVAQLP